jgi:transposase InsO family protein
MSELYDRYRQRIVESVGGLPSASGVAVMLAACERMYAVLAQNDMRGACDTQRLRKILDSMWDGRVLNSEFSTLPEDIEVDSLSVELGMMAADSIQMDWLSLLKQHGIVPSMSRRGNCHDNAVAESFFSALKKERIKRRIYPTRDEAHSDVFNCIEMFYNPVRWHGSAGDLAPVEFERRYAQSGS